MDAGRKVDQASGWSEVSDNSCTDSERTILEVSSVASDQDRFDKPMRRSDICLRERDLRSLLKDLAN